MQEGMESRDWVPRRVEMRRAAPAAFSRITTGMRHRVRIGGVLPLGDDDGLETIGDGVVQPKTPPTFPLGSVKLVEPVGTPEPDGKATVAATLE